MPGVLTQEPPLTRRSIEHADVWHLSEEDLATVPAGEPRNRLGFGVLLRFFRSEARFPDHAAAIPAELIAQVAAQLGAPAECWSQYGWGGRVWKRHRQQIREMLGFRPATVTDAKQLAEWLSTTVVGAERSEDHLAGYVRVRCREMRLEPPTLERTQRIVRSAVHQYEQRLYARIHARLPEETQGGLDALLDPLPGEGAEPVTESVARATLNLLRADAGRPSVRSVQEELAKLARVRSLALPPDLFHDVSAAEVELYRQRVAVEASYELRRHAGPVRHTWLSAYVYRRGRQITDTLVDLLIDTIHGIGARAERKVEREMLEDLRRVTGKQNLLFRIA
jgi:hypothetical protein